jgi:membrane-bound lytic murein transglycosylase D
MRLRSFSLSIACVVLAACAAQPQRAAAPSSSHASLYGEMERQTLRFERALEQTEERGTEASAEGLAALAALREAGERCATSSGCESQRFITAYAELLERQAARTLAAPVEMEDTALVEPEEDSSPLIADLPEAGRSINLLNGRELRDVIAVNGQVKAALNEWLTWMRPLLIDAWENYQYMRHQMWPEYEQAGLPEALLFGIMAKESGGRVHAVSRAGAAGPLQFMPATGQRLGLGRGADGFDTRFDPRASARANVRYLNERFREFNHDLALALAAYNGGEGRMLRLVRETGKRNFWDPAVHSRLPPETRDYVPMVLAAAWLFLHPEDYGLEFPKIDVEPAQLVLESEMSLNALTICLGNGGTRNGWFRALRNLNPRFQTQQALPAGTTLNVPAAALPVYQQRCVGGRQQLALELAGAAQRHPTQVSTASTSTAAASGGLYTVRKGDNLGAIASRHHCRSTEALAKVNGIAAPRFMIKPGQKLRLDGCRRS